MPIVHQRAPGKVVVFSGWAMTRILSGVLVGLDAGATGVAAVGPERPAELDGQLLQAAAEAGPEVEALARDFLSRHSNEADSGPRGEYLDTDTAHCWFVRAPLDLPDLRGRLGLPDVVVDIGTLFHEFDVRRRLHRLAALGASTLVIDTVIVEAEAMPPQSGFSTDSAWFAAAMTPDQCEAMAAYWQAKQPLPDQFRLLPRGGSVQAFRAAGGAPWWWFMGHGAVRRMLAEVGYEVVAVEPCWGGRSAIFVAERRA
ncbi:hypothetical protein EOD42_17035 [Rhodovarius crocodyli]|uniref:Class I SAM-dependent methyltransferase n=1 Tax=Rhodovarius crocodyli TaxID=1979269 RepID=A0A437MCD1_9PROT|nr:hypothetical protein [Rhodovarius crocodyli]RVT95288.1 hypothetical protein EOD42_17035 [Rhodovarius crocodyli]